MSSKVIDIEDLDVNDPAAWEAYMERVRTLDAEERATARPAGHRITDAYIAQLATEGRDDEAAAYAGARIANAAKDAAAADPEPSDA